MKPGLVSALLFIAVPVVFSPAKEAGWTGNYTDKKFLNGQAVFQLNIVQEGSAISVDFDAVYNDGHGCAPQASGPSGGGQEHAQVHLHRQLEQFGHGYD